MGDQKILVGMCGVFFSGPLVKVRGDSHDWCGRWLAKRRNPSLRASPYRSINAEIFRTILEVPRSHGRNMGAAVTGVRFLSLGT